MIKTSYKARNVMRADMPTDIRLSERLRNYKELGVENALRSPEIYDDLANEPTDNMVPDPLKQPCIDPWELADTMYDGFAKADALAKASQQADGQQKAEGAEHTEQGEVND